MQSVKHNRFCRLYITYFGCCFHPDLWSLSHFFKGYLGDSLFWVGCFCTAFCLYPFAHTKGNTKNPPVPCNKNEKVHSKQTKWQSGFEEEIDNNILQQLSFVLLCHSEPQECHSELVEESPSSTTYFVSEIILSYNLLVSIYALLLSFQILQSLCSLRMTGVGRSQNDGVSN